jgi:predicted transcriptional regulator YheO
MRWALPGAPSALLQGRPSLHEDTSRLDLSEYDLHEDIKSQIREYFGPTGDGRAVRSFVSLLIGRERENPIGILNIDSDHPNVLGNDRYHDTFYALVTPFLSMLAAPVAEYAYLLTEEKAHNVALLASAPESDITPRAGA